ncbi:aminotransferase class V-fold PLP-dependent enzyme [Nitrososphaera viennensis]|uniref:Aminotransferase class V-fold PLP-dependent enzyme n=2 Tax=Nitrososphaera viennensis TaxID=1034015 RepID=A0A977NMQ4_9ARCH|nr:aminotransferase class V-fold PLP-dependent enzyme [Nitrososphaera viennensis]AIC17193.1 putative cysteine desulfurase [Nitrososphaera viennensis EN76]UVS69080.1 aminotransferase class V-fold PLP-dependent enzyme [Nitrososphaera viennensis]
MTVAPDAPDLRTDFPITKKMIYMNNGAVAPTPLAVVKATTDFMVKCADEGPDAQATSDYITLLLKELRTRVAHLINCEPEEVVLTQSTTEGINIVANGISWQKGDTIIARGGKHEHPANYLPWLRLSQQRGMVLKELAIDENGFFDLDELEKAARKSRLVTMSHALYNTGAIMPLEEVGRITEENNALFCVDAAQTAGTIRIDVKKIGCHFMAFPGFKWLCGPMGMGILYCSKKAAEMLEPPSIGGESAMVSGNNSSIIAIRGMPHRLQTGFRNYPGAAGLEAALRYILRVGIDNIRSANMKVAEALRQELGRIEGVTLHGPQDVSKRTSIVTFSVPKDPSMIVRKLEEESGTVLAEREVAGGRKIIRAAPHFFNTEAQAATIAAQIKALLLQ